MVDWLGLEKNFRDIHDPFSDMRADWRDQEGIRNNWRISGWIDSNAQKRFETLAKQGGRLLLKSNAATISKCSSDLQAIEDDMVRWLTAVREITDRFEFLPNYAEKINNTIHIIERGEIKRIIEVSATLCRVLSIEEATTSSTQVKEELKIGSDRAKPTGLVEFTITKAKEKKFLKEF